MMLNMIQNRTKTGVRKPTQVGAVRGDIVVKVLVSCFLVRALNPKCSSERLETTGFVHPFQ